MTEKEELAKAISESRQIVGQKRVRNRRDNRGRPIKQSGVYYTRSILVNDKTMLFIRKRRLPGEPLGATLDRLLGEVRKKEQALKNEFVEDTPENWRNMWNNVTNKDIPVYRQSFIDSQ